MLTKILILLIIGMQVVTIIMLYNNNPESAPVPGGLMGSGDSSGDNSGGGDDKKGGDNGLTDPTPAPTDPKANAANVDPNTVAQANAVNTTTESKDAVLPTCLEADKPCNAPAANAGEQAPASAAGSSTTPPTPSGSDATPPAASNNLIQKHSLAWEARDSKNRDQSFLAPALSSRLSDYDQETLDLDGDTKTQLNDTN